MAKLCACYALCPLIDRCPIGVTPDSTPGCVIVTLGKNIVIRYKLADQKQASSWSCKDKLSAPVIYDHVGKQYIGVFNHSIVRLWNDINVNLNREKKHKFDQPLHLVLSHSHESEPVVIYQNGSVLSLSKALRSRKEKSREYVPSDKSIKECFFIRFNGTDCVGIHASNDFESSFLIIKVDDNRDPLYSITLKRQGAKLLGLTVMHTETTADLLTFWNDGQLWSQPLCTSSEKDCIGKYLYSVTAVSSKHEIVMVQISPHHVAMYGADPSEEGAMLIIFNTQFRIVQARQHYKMFSDKANLWVIGSSILLVVGYSLAVAPFVLDTERLSSLIGSHQPSLQLDLKDGEVQEVRETKSIVWEKLTEQKHQSKKATARVGVKTSQSNSPSGVLDKLAAQGYSQAMACEILVPSLIKEKNAVALLWILQNLPDFPETALVHILTFCLDAPRETFHALKLDSDPGGVLEEDSQDLRQSPVNLSDPGVLEEGSQDLRQSQVNLSLGQRVLLNVIFTTPLSEAILLPIVRSKLSLPHCLTLLQYIAQSLPQTTSLLFSRALLRWGAVLLDSHYQQLLLSREECITTTVLALKEIIKSQVEYFDDLKALYPMVEKVRKGQAFHNIRSTASYQYCIETLNLYE